jgi:hypothetical protein
VSRHHARIVEDDEGRAILIDLASNNGTFVDSHRIKRHRLNPGDEFRILRSRFRFEESDEPEHETDAPVPAVYAVKVNSIETMRRTIDHWLEDLPAPTGRDTEVDYTVPPELQRRSQPSPRERLVEGPDAARHAVIAVRPDGSAYPGDVLSDILHYRSLRVQNMRGENLDKMAALRFAALGKLLGQDSTDPAPQARQRMFQRFPCRFPAQLRHGGTDGDRTSPAFVHDIGAGGARVKVLSAEAGDASRPAALAVGELAWLVINLVIGRRSQTIVFTTRVVATDEGALGLIFAGAPEWEHWRAGSST